MLCIGGMVHCFTPHAPEASSPGPEWLLATGTAKAPPKGECPERPEQIKGVA